VPGVTDFIILVYYFTFLGLRYVMKSHSSMVAPPDLFMSICTVKSLTYLGIMQMSSEIRYLISSNRPMSGKG
jgi:hypothetical protein